MLPDDQAAADAGGDHGEKTPAAATKLFAYLLPFVTVREVRRTLGLTGDFAGDDQVASDWAAKHPASAPVGGGEQ